MKLFYLLFLLAFTPLVLFSDGEFNQDSNLEKQNTQTPRSKTNLFEEDPHQRDAWLESTYGDPKNYPSDIDNLQREFAKTLPIANEGYFKKGVQAQSQTWLNAGPNNIGGRTRAVAYDVNNPNIIIAGGVSGGIWRSVDGGQSWVQTSGLDEVASVTAIVQDTRPGKTHTWYYAGGEIRGNSAGESKGVNHEGEGIHVSTDNGLTWNLIEETNSNKFSYKYTLSNVIRLVLDHTNTEKNIIYAACNGCIMRSENGGKTWSYTLGYGTNSVYGGLFSDLVISPEGTLYAALSTGMYGSTTSNKYGFFRSTDGINWEDISPEDLSSKISRAVIATSGNDDQGIYFLSAIMGGTGDYCPETGICFSLYKLDYNNKANWTNLSHNLPYVEGSNDYGTLNAQMGYNLCMAVKPDNPKVIFIGGTNLFVTNSAFEEDDCQWIAGYSPEYDDDVFYDSTATWDAIISEWSQMMFPTGGWDFHSFVFNPKNPDVMITASDHGLHRINNIEQAIINEEFVWDDLNNGYNTTQFYDCSIHPTEAGNEVIIGGMQDNGTWGTFSSDINYQYITGGDGMHSEISPLGDIIVSSQGGNLMSVGYNGNKMTSGYFLYPYKYSSVFFPFYAPFKINPNNYKSLVIGGYQSVAFCTDFKDSDNLSQNWIVVNYGSNFGETTALAFSASKENQIYVAAESDGLYKIYDITDTLSEIKRIEYPADVNYAYTSDLWVNPSDDNNLIVTISDYNSRSILETSDGGESWIDHGGNLEESENGHGNGPSVRAYGRLNYKGDTVHFVGTSAGLYSTKKLDGFNTVWVREGASTIGMALVSKIQTRDSDGKIVVSTHGNGIFQTNYSTSVEDFDGSNLGFIVSEVFPNPASSKINFVLNSDENAFVKARILDLQGKIIATIISEKISGTRKINFDSSNLAPGTYFINFSDGSHFTTKKVNIIR